MEKKRVIFYVDGFNFYYGLKRKKKADDKWSRFYWIDVVKLFEQFIGPDQELVKVVYFTASPLEPDKRVKVYFPPTNFSFDINSFMKTHNSTIVRLESNAVKFNNAIMPETVTVGDKSYTIPDSWK